jgi:virginiamycin A acetyltransferase
VPDYSIVAGNRATVQRMRFDAKTIAELNEVAWWDWDIDRILEHEDAIVGRELQALLRAGGKR